MGRDHRDNSRDMMRSRERSNSRHQVNHGQKRRESPSSSRSSSSSSSSSTRNRRRKKAKKEKKSKKAKKKQKKSRRRSSSSDADTDSSTELLNTLQKERMALKRKRKEEKRKLKETETEEERKNRKLLKKEIKALRRLDDDNFSEVEVGLDEEQTYTNEDNPFGDSQLTNGFKWDKKLQKEGLDKLDERELKKLERLKREKQRQELEKVKTQRMYREKEREDFLYAKELEDRMKENAKYSQWQDKEDEFHLQQAKMRSKIRIQDGRAKPIDLLAKYISAEEELDTIEMHEPYTYLNGLTINDLEDLLVDIRVYVGMDEEKNWDYWEDIIVIVEDELQKLRKLDATSSYEIAAERRQGINKAVADDIQGVFKDKSSQQLETLKKSIELKLSQQADGLDLNYWESLLSQLKAHLARARLRDSHKDNLKKKLDMLKAEQKGQSAPVVKAEEAQDPGEGPSQVSKNDETDVDMEIPDQDPREEIKEYLPKEKEIDLEDEEYKCGGYSPIYRELDDLELGAIVVNAAEDEARRRVDQTKVLKGGKVDSVLNAEEKALEREAKKGMNDDEASFAVESALEQTYEWSDKYRPRKPRYFNRVHTGFEWNKYNQTHYDIDNPPPKVVQGYKFNIFYPDLINKKNTPQYTITPCQDNTDFAILRVHAGPPYEDIAFKIVNREWEFGYKRGFKCQFHNNIFQLWFHFKRLRYRR
ncbi:hypothetical protein TCAL_01833 [Tigriopus californicus]|uniref:Splicing factor Cactin n=1 Tax=Tigriopus californicus TaxID=6832 RepID=A0A553NEI1_TIGCA|nr:splicing factor Cactin-like [Tigriopus californicus]TRY63850.1 hypothetical protein TCAL_01833 [Tigriopus californicus]|eukprot:TCALIF_01833-PA protein Name:"Similar to cactin Cactin (Drosophila melanogaster)" AED:0.00 eAED:0.00 QI:0/-1/0/1/-1/1/1/0/702